MKKKTFFAIFAAVVITIIGTSFMLSCSKRSYEEKQAALTSQTYIVNEFNITIKVDESLFDKDLIFVVNGTERKFTKTEVPGQYVRTIVPNIGEIKKVRIKMLVGEEYQFVDEKLYKYMIEGNPVTKRGIPPVKCEEMK